MKLRTQLDLEKIDSLLKHVEQVLVPKKLFEEILLNYPAYQHDDMRKNGIRRKNGIIKPHEKL